MKRLGIVLMAVITAVTATPDLDGESATIAWSTNEPASSRVDYGTSPGSLTQNVSSATLENTHSIVLSGLTPGSTVYYRVTSADAASNATTEPNPPAAPLSFTLPSPACFTDATSADFAA